MCVTQLEVSPTPFDRLKASLGEDWPAITESRAETEKCLEKLRAICERADVPGNTAVVCFGSLARGEWTSGSDVDWTLLVDGMSDPEHFLSVQRIAKAIHDSGLPGPGPTGTFGQLTSSHELIHHIGGSGDTNQNLTRRMLLLLESIGLPTANSIVQERVVRAALERYVVSDPAVSALGKPEWRVPRFLLNDVVRYWRTIAVDYATKKWERAGHGWALRNVKLRMSRKLLFAKGLLLCFDCESGDHSTANDQDVLKAIASRCFQLGRLSPIDLLSQTMLDHDETLTARTIFGAYDEFLRTLNDPSQRDVLKKLDASTAVSDTLFLRLRDLSHEYSEGLERLFFDSNAFQSLTRRYGVF
jgi:predicted nucleotidyltransferase